MPYICEKCEDVCDVVSGDDGGYEEAWGARTWVPSAVTVSDCCGHDVEDVSEEEAEIVEQVNYIQRLVQSGKPTGKEFGILRDMLWEARQ
jgi:hypothetical protein